MIWTALASKLHCSSYALIAELVLFLCVFSVVFISIDSKHREERDRERHCCLRGIVSLYIQMGYM